MSFNISLFEKVLLFSRKGLDIKDFKTTEQEKFDIYMQAVSDIVQYLEDIRYEHQTAPRIKTQLEKLCNDLKPNLEKVKPK